MIKNKNYELTLSISKKPGVLSSLMVKGNLIGLAYRRKKEEVIDKNQLKLVLSFTGDLGCRQQEAINIFQSDPDVINVEKMVVLNTEDGMHVETSQPNIMARLKSILQKK